MKKVLIIDDDFVRSRGKIYESVLSEKFQIFAAQSANEVFTKIESLINEVDLFLVDIVLANWKNSNTGEPLHLLDVLNAIGPGKGIILVSNAYKTLIDNDKLTLLMNSIIQGGYTILSFIVWAEFEQTFLDANLWEGEDAKPEFATDEENAEARKGILVNKIELDLLRFEEKRLRRSLESAKLGVVAALDIELAPFLSRLDKETCTTFFKQGYHFTRGLIDIKGRKVPIIAAKQEKMGMVDASFLSSVMVTECKVQHLFMIGVCGGRPGESDIGDIIVPLDSVAYQGGKLTNNGFLTDIEIASCNSQIKTGLTDEYWTAVVKELFNEHESMYLQENKKSTGLAVPRVKFDAMGCGDIIVDKVGQADAIAALANKRKLCGIEMESYSVLRASNIFADSHVRATVIKSVMDNTQDKDDFYKFYAAFMAAGFLYRLLTDGKYNYHSQ